jgi:hypothetical protein
MADTHVVSALKEKRIKLATELEGLQAQRQRVIGLEHCEATLKLFDGRARNSAARYTVCRRSPRRGERVCRNNGENNFFSTLDSGLTLRA